MMISISFPIVFVIISVIFSQRTLSSDQYEEASVETKIRTEQHPIKTFQNQYGDTYDCVDIYKQFSLTHSLLKNHKIQMRPSSIPIKTMFIKDDSSSKSKKTIRRSTRTTNKHLNVIEEGLEGPSKNTCPRGTVPIRRSLTQQKKEEQEEEGLVQNQNDSSDYVSLFAGITTKGIPTKNYRGAYGKMSLYNPKVTADQMSGVVISIQSGGDRAFLNKVETGWMVNPSLYGDTNTRLYTSWTTDDRFRCYNTICPGFIVISRDTPVDLVFNQTTVGESQRYQIDLAIFQDRVSGNWWLVRVYGFHKEFIGYWPKEILPRLENGAQVVQMGGIVSSSSYQSKPPMGSGFKFAKRFNYFNTAFFAQIQFTNDDNIPFPGDNAFIDTISNRCYKSTDNSYKDYTMTGYDFVFGYSFVFGGQGGDEVACELMPNNMF